jgi:hypothetical protein
MKEGKIQPIAIIKGGKSMTVDEYTQAAAAPAAPAAPAQPAAMGGMAGAPAAEKK